MIPERAAGRIADEAPINSFGDDLADLPGVEIPGRVAASIAPPGKLAAMTPLFAPLPDDTSNAVREFRIGYAIHDDVTDGVFAQLRFAPSLEIYVQG